jgi:hypothetical protein
MDLRVRPSVQLVLDGLHSVADPGGAIYYDWAVVGLLRIPPASAALPRVLGEDQIWPATRRTRLMSQIPSIWSAVMREQTFWRANPGEFPGPRAGIQLSALISRAQTFARHENSAEVREWHVARALVEMDPGPYFDQLQIDKEMLVRRVGELEGLQIPSEVDLVKAWCFTDANFFLQYKIFDQVDWSKELDLTATVLVVPTSVLRSLDHYKSDFDNKRRHRRARQILPLLAKYALSVAPGYPAVVGKTEKRVELLIRDREPFVPPGLDPNDQDDRIIADALDFKWTRPGARVIVLSEDYTVRLKARSWGLEQIQMPEALKLPSYLPPIDESSAHLAEPTK